MAHPPSGRRDSALAPEGAQIRPLRRLAVGERIPSRICAQGVFRRPDGRGKTVAELVQADLFPRVSSVDVAWYAWDPDLATYREVVDATAFRSLVRSYSIGIVRMLTDPLGRNYNDEEAFEDSPSAIPSRDWYLRDPPPEGARVDWIRVLYTISGVEYFLTLYNE